MADKKIIKKKKVKVVKEREIKTYVDLWRVSEHFLETGIKEVKGEHYNLLSCFVFKAFTLEAYLNHIGEYIFNCWDDLEKLSPKGKLNIISEKLGIGINYSERPWQVMNRLFKSRNLIVHAKTENKKEELYCNIENYEDTMHAIIKTDWEKDCTKENIERTRDDVEIIIKELHKRAGHGEYPFVSGIQTSSASLQVD